jgi:hypothetical protein
MPRAVPYHLGMTLLVVGTKVRFLEHHRPSQGPWRAIGVIVDAEERPTADGRPQSWVRARFGFITPWIEGWKVERVS